MSVSIASRDSYDISDPSVGSQRHCGNVIKFEALDNLNLWAREIIIIGSRGW